MPGRPGFLDPPSTRSARAVLVLVLVVSGLGASACGVTVGPTATRVSMAIPIITTPAPIPTTAATAVPASAASPTAPAGAQPPVPTAPPVPVPTPSALAASQPPAAAPAVLPRTPTARATPRPAPPAPPPPPVIPSSPADHLVGPGVDVLVSAMAPYDCRGYSPPLPEDRAIIDPCAQPVTGVPLIDGHNHTNLLWNASTTWTTGTVVHYGGHTWQIAQTRVVDHNITYYPMPPRGAALQIRTCQPDGIHEWVWDLVRTS
jgi:hypothetical protein